MIKLTEFDQPSLDEGAAALAKAIKAMGRSQPRSDFVRNLLLCDHKQQIGSGAIYAVSDFETGPGGRKQVAGGTGYAVQMSATESPERPIYLYAQRQGKWFSLLEAATMEWAEMKIGPPRPSGFYTGIGARALVSNKPIVALFAQEK